MGGDAPFCATEPDEETLAKAYYSSHDLRDMYSRDNTERRRTGGHTLRKHLTAAQDKKLTAQFVKIRDEWCVTNNNDAVLVFVQQLVADGKGDEVDPKLREMAASVTIPRRSTPFAPEADPLQTR